MIFEFSKMHSLKNQGFFKVGRMCLGGVLISLVPIAHASISSDGPTLEQVSRCFFIYAPIIEVAKKSSYQPLFDYAVPRVSWLAGFIQAKQGDTVFQQVFAKSGAVNKAYGIGLEQRLIVAVNAVKANGNAAQATLLNVLKPASECDKYIGMEGR